MTGSVDVGSIDAGSLIVGFGRSPGTAVGRDDAVPRRFSSQRDGRFKDRGFRAFRARGAESSCSFTWG